MPELFESIKNHQYYNTLYIIYILYILYILYCLYSRYFYTK